ELQGGEQKTLSVWIRLASPAGHRGESSSQQQALRWAYHPPQILQSARWYRKSDVFPWFPDESTDRISSPDAAHVRRRFADYLQQATTGQHSLQTRRAAIDEYGWRNFGDIPADHEQTHYSGSNTVVSHYNNQFDLVFGGILNFARTADSSWHELFCPLARHVMDIDIYHTTGDRAAFSGGLFWHTDHYVDARTCTHRTYSRCNAAERDSYGGGPANEHNYTTGLLYYYFLTGNREARESVLSLADWVIRMDDGRRTIWGVLDSGDTGLASKTVFEDFHGPGRGVGNSVNALLDAWILTAKPEYLNKAEQLIRRVVHPQQNLEELHLLDAEGHWSYTVCLTALGRYLQLKLEAGQTDAEYSYARDTLIHYGKWMAAHERPTLSEPDKLKYPTEAWAAQDLRKANVMRIAASCTNNAADELRMRRRADEISDQAWRDLYSFGDRHLTARCLSIVMTEGLREVFHRCCRPSYLPPGRTGYPQTTWTMFVPQRIRVKQLLKHPARTILAAVRGGLNPMQWIRSLNALRQQL
ncbi:MAG: hypothetical protein KDA89_02640, partial [Planctomycetaceae bacterium]|nr:hypothetical protein [Planctomycetaceae bacterium]